jgi:hypothetical protein
MGKVFLTENELIDLIKNVVGKVVDLPNTDDITPKNVLTKISNAGADVKNKVSDIVDKFKGEKSKETKTSKGKSYVDSDWMSITKKVIDKLEGGYWNPKCKHPSSGMGRSTETMFGLDRYNGAIERTEDGKEFFEIIDQQKEDLGMDKFCKKWKWLYRGGEHEEELKTLAAKIMKNAFDRNMDNFVDAETERRIKGNRGLLLHMSYATWNGPGFFKKFANSLEKGVKKGMSDKQLIELAIQDRSSTGLLNKSKVANLIKNA